MTALAMARQAAQQGGSHIYHHTRGPHYVASVKSGGSVSRDDGRWAANPCCTRPPLYPIKTLQRERGGSRFTVAFMAR